MKPPTDAEILAALHRSREDIELAARELGISELQVLRCLWRSGRDPRPSRLLLGGKAS